MLAGRTEWRDVPHAPTERVEFKTLSGLQMQRAREKVDERQTKAYAATVAQWDEQQLAKIRAVEKSARKEKEPDYDGEMLIKWAINAWSLDIPCTDENKLMLDGPTFEWAIGVIVEMNTLPLAKSADSLSGENSHRNSETLIVSSPAE